MRKSNPAPRKKPKNRRPKQPLRPPPRKKSRRPRPPTSHPAPRPEPAAPGPRPWAASRRHPRLRFSSSRLARCLAILEAQPGPRPPAGEISCAFLTDDELARLHEKFLADPSPTDVITFPADSAAGLAGEICLSVDQAAIQSVRRRLPFARELTLYLVHGWLHLCGYDDHTAADRRLMRRMERRCLSALTRARAVPDFRLG